jgi:hypothetical protein
MAPDARRRARREPAPIAREDLGPSVQLRLHGPDLEGGVSDGYIHVASPNFRIGFALRFVVVANKTQEDAVQGAHKLRVCYLLDADDAPKQKFVNPGEMVCPTLPCFDERAFEDLDEIFSVEPVRLQDKVMMGLRAEIGIEKGKPYNPDEKTLKAMRQAAIEVWYTLQNWSDNCPESELHWPDRHYMSLLITDKNRTFTWEYDDRIDCITRAAEYFWCTYVPRKLSDAPSTNYMRAVAGRTGIAYWPARPTRCSFPRTCR